MINRVILVLSIAIFALRGIVYAGDKKEETRQYISKVNPILISVQVTTRNISQKFLSLEAAVKQMEEYIKQLRAIKPPDFMAKQHKMILLSFQKMKMGFYLLTKGEKSVSIPLVKRGAELLRTAAKDLVEVLKKEGLIKEKDSRLQQRPVSPPVAPASMFSPAPSPHIATPIAPGKSKKNAR